MSLLTIKVYCNFQEEYKHSSPVIRLFTFPSRNCILFENKAVPCLQLACLLHFDKDKLAIQGYIQEFVQGGGGGVYHPLGPYNPLETMNLTDPGGGLSPHVLLYSPFLFIDKVFSLIMIMGKPYLWLFYPCFTILGRNSSSIGWIHRHRFPHP